MASVLVVDDYPDIANIIAEFLEDAGHDVTKAYSTEEAIAYLHKAPFDIVVTDLVMKNDERGAPIETDTSGLEVLRKAKHLELFTEVIVLTAFGAVETAVPAMKLDAFDYVKKSAQIDEEGDFIDKVVNTVHKAVEHRAAHKRESHEQVTDFILNKLAESGVVSVPKLLARSRFHPAEIRATLKELVEAGKIEKSVVPKTDIEVYKKHHPRFRDKVRTLF
jgi:DNA-binding NtrC family response regulator